MISQRIRDALASVKARGVRLGGHRANSDQTRTEAIERAEALRGVFEKLASLSARAAAEELNRRGITTVRGGKWQAVQGYPCTSEAGAIVAGRIWRPDSLKPVDSHYRNINFQ
jgi:sugar phosphate isomerase/epimerase